MSCIFRVFDILRGPGLFERLWHRLVHTSPLTEDEIAAASAIIGANTVRYERVRIATGGILRLIFRLNGGRAFTTFHTLNLSGSGYHSRENIAIVVHELVHVVQFERIGSVYIPQALRAQRGGGYGYGGAEGLREARSRGESLDHYNREQQGQIVQDYCQLVLVYERAEDDPTRQAYEPFIEDIRQGII